MIKIKRHEDSKDTVDISIEGNAEDVAKEYAVLTLNLRQKYGPIWDRAMNYVERVMAEQ